jgi:hypothetical protein
MHSLHRWRSRWITLRGSRRPMAYEEKENFADQY